MTRKSRRLALIGLAGAALALATVLVLVALQDRIVFFYSPSDIAEKEVGPGTRMRLGGLVAAGSVDRSEGETIVFRVTDTERTIPVVFTGALPDLFREGQGVVAEGVLRADGTFAADSILAKHDEAYMPREVADALRERGVWQDAEGKSQ